MNLFFVIFKILEIKKNDTKAEVEKDSNKLIEKPDDKFEITENNESHEDLSYEEFEQALQSDKTEYNFEEKSTRILKAWLFDHQNKPYPLVKEVEELSIEANLAISQVINSMIIYFGN